MTFTKRSANDSVDFALWPRHGRRSLLRRVLAFVSCAAIFACASDPAATESADVAEARTALGSTAGLDNPILFDAQYYSSLYPDLQSAFGGNATALRNHWLANGIGEGRRASPVFDCALYLGSYPDLRNAFGSDCALAMAHFLNTGLPLEGRRASIEFDVSSYLTRYTDLANAFGSKGYLQAARHFMGLSGGGLWTEGRAGSNEFDVSYYRYHYSDLTRLGNDFRTATVHFFTQGLQESRRGSVTFDVVNYLSRYPLVKSAYGTNYVGAMYHWIIVGKAAGYTGNPGDNGGDYYGQLPAPSNFRSGGTSIDWNSRHGVNLGWDVVPGAAYYDIRRSAPNGTTMVASQQMTGAANFYIWDDLDSAVYKFQIGACNTMGNCTYSSTQVTGDTRSQPPPVSSTTGTIWFKYYDSVSVTAGTCFDQKLSVTLSPNIWNYSAGTFGQDAEMSSCPGIRDFTKYKCCGWELARSELSPGNYPLSFTRGQTCNVTVPITAGKTQVVTSHEGQCPTVPPAPPTSGSINMDLQFTLSGTSCGSSSFYVDGAYIASTNGWPYGSICHTQATASPLALKNHWVCAAWGSYCCECVTLTSTYYTQNVVLDGADCMYSTFLPPATCK